MAYTGIPTRENVSATEQLMTLIAKGTCWHFDAWMLRDDQGRLYVLVQTRAGGRKLIWEMSYTYENGVLRAVMEIPEQAQFITLQDKAEWPHFDELNRLHWERIVPMTRRVPDGFRSRSVALHYVRAPSLEPFTGTEINKATGAYPAENSL